MTQFPIQIYTRPDCKQCRQLKEELKSRNIPFFEYEVDKDVTREWFLANFPGKALLPVAVTVNGVYSGPIEIGHLLSEYKSDVGKQLLNEDEAEFEI